MPIDRVATETSSPVEISKTLGERQPWWLMLFEAAAGLALDWRCAYEWFDGKSSFYSGLVLGRTGLIVLACAAVAVLAVCVSRKAKWRHAVPLFCAVSLVLYNILSVHWIAHRR